jgi:hypothetical protein
LKKSGHACLSISNFNRGTERNFLLHSFLISAWKTQNSASEQVTSLFSCFTAPEKLSVKVILRYAIQFRIRRRKLLSGRGNSLFVTHRLIFGLSFTILDLIREERQSSFMRCNSTWSSCWTSRCYESYDSYSIWIWLISPYSESEIMHSRSFSSTIILLLFW